MLYSNWNPYYYCWFNSLNDVFNYIRELGIDTLSLCSDEREEMFKLAQVMFDTKLPPGVKVLQPFSDDSSIKKVAVRVCVFKF